MIVRKVFEDCSDEFNNKLSDYVVRLITIGTPNMGINMTCLTTTMNYWEFVSDKFTLIGPKLTEVGCKMIYGEASPKIYLHRKEKPSLFILDMLLYKAT